MNRFDDYPADTPRTGDYIKPVMRSNHYDGVLDVSDGVATWEEGCNSFSAKVSDLQCIEDYRFTVSILKTTTIY